MLFQSSVSCKREVHNSAKLCLESLFYFRSRENWRKLLHCWVYASGPPLTQQRCTSYCAGLWQRRSAHTTKPRRMCESCRSTGCTLPVSTFQFNFFWGKKCMKILQNIRLERADFHQLIQSDSFVFQCRREEFGVWRVFSMELFRPQTENGDEVALKRLMPNWHHQLFFLCVAVWWAKFLI